MKGFANDTFVCSDLYDIRLKRHARNEKEIKW